LLVSLLANGCRHLNSPAANARRLDDNEGKDFVLVYSLPEKRDPLYASLAGFFNNPLVQGGFKAVVEAGACEETDDARKLLIVGTADTSPRVRSCLKEFGVELSERKVTIGGRSYTLAPYAFTARYESNGKTVCLAAAATYSCFNMTLDSIQPGSYELLNADSRIVEQGSVQKLGDGWKLIPAVVHPDAAFLPEQRAKEIETAVTAAAYVPIGPEDFSFVDRIAAGKKVFFIGEAPHFDVEVHHTVPAMAIHLRKEFRFGMMATESFYSLWPYLEARSLGSDVKPAEAFQESDRGIIERMAEYNRSARLLVAQILHYDDILSPIADYNRSAPWNKKLLCTGADRDYIIHPNTNTTLYLGYLASTSSSSEARSDLAKAIPALLQLNGREELHACVDDLEQKFRSAWSSFSPQLQDEIAFTLSIERLSIDAQCDADGGAVLRAECFRKTLEHALTKAQRSGGNLICYTGAEHAKLTETGPGDVEMGITEARFFNKLCPLSKGRVASIKIEHIGQVNKPRDPGTLEEAALALMGDRDRVFINLRHKSWAAVKNRPASFFAAKEPKWDGVLFIK
jgi:hypothetical protein